MTTRSGVAAWLGQARAEANMNSELSSTSEIKSSVVRDQVRAEEAARVAHAACRLDQAGFAFTLRLPSPRAGEPLLLEPCATFPPGG